MNDVGGVTIGAIWSHSPLVGEGLVQQVALQVSTEVFLGTFQLQRTELCKKAEQCEEGAVIL